MLYIVSTPIGNLEDITLRGIETLKEVDFILCEDTRHSTILLNKYNIKNKLISFHSKTGKTKIDNIAEKLKNHDVALISDAGTPGISDPGFSIIQKAKDANIPISPIPGPSAFLSALVVCGFSINQFTYLGFIPNKKGRQTFLKNLQDTKLTTVFYESSHRIYKLLDELEKYIPEKEIMIGKEITKKFEEFIFGTPKKIKEKLTNNKGEFVVVVRGK